jgi:hypothetical protein
VGSVSIDSCVNAVSVYTMAWSDDYRDFVVEESIQNGGSPIIIYIINNIYMYRLKLSMC